MAEAKKPPFVQLTILGLLLVVLPAGSYIYLKRGYDYRVESLSELEPVGAAADLLPALEVPPRRVGVAYGFGGSLTDSARLALANIDSAFRDQPDVFFFPLDGVPSLRSPRKTISATASIDVGSPLRRSLAEAPFCAVPLDRLALLLDTAGQVRRCYDLHDGPSVARLVEHLTIVVPPAREEDIFVEREREY